MFKEGLRLKFYEGLGQCDILSSKVVSALFSDPSLPTVLQVCVHMPVGALQSKWFPSFLPFMNL